MKWILGPGAIAGLSLVCVLCAAGQTQSATTSSNAAALPTPVHALPANTAYQYDFIAKHDVWSNRPLNSTASKICQTMRDRAFSESAYAINGDQDWNQCLDTQIRSIGYMRWLTNDGLKPNSRNRASAKDYLRRTYTMGRWGSYTFTQLSQAFKATTGMHP